MDAEKKLKVYTAMAETTRKWVTIMDAKAAFISTLNAGLLTFIWTGAKLTGEAGCAYYLAIAATVASFLSLACALRTVLRKSSAKFTNYKTTTKPVSFYGFVAKNYPLKDGAGFIEEVGGMDEEAFAREALEQHFVTSHVAQYKSSLLIAAGGFFFLGLTLATAALLLK